MKPQLVYLHHMGWPCLSKSIASLEIKGEAIYCLKVKKPMCSEQSLFNVNIGRYKKKRVNAIFH